MVTSFNAVGPSSAGQKLAGTGTLSWSHVVGASANLLLVGFAWSGGLGSQSATVTFNSVAMTRVATIPSNNDSAGYIDVYYLKNPSVGTFTVSISTGTGDMEGGSLSYIGHDGTNPTSVTGFGSSATASTGAITSNANSMVAGFYCCGNSFSSTSNNQRIISNLNTNGGAGNFAANDATGAASVTLTAACTSDFWGAVGVQIAGTGGSPVVSDVPVGYRRRRSGLLVR